MDADEKIIVLSDDDELINDNKKGSSNCIVSELYCGEDKQQNDLMHDFAPPPTNGEQLYFGNDDFLMSDGLIFDYLEQQKVDDQECPTISHEFNDQTQKPTKTLKRPKNREQKDEEEEKEEKETMPGKRKKRTKEEIIQEKLEKQVNKIRREILSSKNSKCEKYLFCYCSTRILQIDDQIEEEIRKRFEERGISGQIIYENSPTQTMRIIWKRKRIDATMEDGKLISKEIMEVQNCFFSVLSGDTFTQLAKTKNGILDYIKATNHIPIGISHQEDASFDYEQITANKVKRARLTLIILGKHTIRENTVDSLIFEAYEQFGAQFRFVRDTLDFSFFVVQMHRSLAKFEKKAEKMMEEAGTFIAEKGIADGPEMVSDWWTKMLDHMHRMHDDQKRAIVHAYPNPIKLMDRLLDPKNSPGNSMFILSEIQMENGRRLGPVLAQKIYKMLTSLDGTEIIDSGQ